MPLPADVITTTVTATYLDWAGKPAKGLGIWTPDVTSVAEDIAIPPLPIRKQLRNGVLTVDLPTSVVGGDNPTLTYEYTLALAGGVYSRRTYQIPVTDSVVEIEELVPLTPTPEAGRFVFPLRAQRPLSPRDGEVYYNATTGNVEFYNGVTDQWVDVSQADGAPPTGAAGGILTGTYPNPGLKPDSIGSEHLKHFSVTAAHLTIEYVPKNSYLNDLAITAQALAALQAELDEKIDISSTARTLVLEVGQEVPDGTPPNTVIYRKTT